MTTALDLGGSSASTWAVQRKCELVPELRRKLGSSTQRVGRREKGRRKRIKRRGREAKKKKWGWGENKGHHFSDSSSLKGPSSPFTGAQ